MRHQFELILLICLLGLLFSLLIWFAIRRAQEIERANAALREEISTRREAEAKLQRVQAELEQRVQELSTANQSLSHEIAERKQAEDVRQKLEEQLRHVHKMQAIGTMARGIAHDFNNILAVIIPYTHLALEETTDRPGVQQELQQVLVASERARLLVQQILTFSGQQRSERQVIDLGPVVTGGMHLLRSVLSAKVEISTRIAPDLPAVCADPSQIQEVLVNLCTNAADAMRGSPGRLEVQLDAFEADETRRNASMLPGKYVRLTVKDNGNGMDPEVQKRIFEPFFTTKGPGEGTGMGLAVVHGIVSDHGGAILLESQPKNGTRFEIFFPARKPDTQRPSTVPDGKGQHVLLVDDEAPLCSVFGQILTHLGYRVTTQTQPSAALKAFCERPDDFDLLFTDLSMPEMSGIELARKILKLRPELPILMATGYTSGAEHEAAKMAGIAKVIAKPIQPSVLATAVHQALQRE